MITWSCLDTGKAIRSLWIGVRFVGPSVEVEVELRTTDGQAEWSGRISLRLCKYTPGCKSGRNITWVP